jgi:hypothetical protein
MEVPRKAGCFANPDGAYLIPFYNEAVRNDHPGTC